jgi:protein AroM
MTALFPKVCQAAIPYQIVNCQDAQPSWPERYLPNRVGHVPEGRGRGLPLAAIPRHRGKRRIKRGSPLQVPSMSAMIGILVIGQSPRPLLLREFRRVVPGSIPIVLRGALDGITREELARYAPQSADDTLLTVLSDGTDIRISHEIVAERAKIKLEEMQREGCRLILFCCTGEFAGLGSSLPLLFPSRIHTQVAQALAKDRRLGVFVPLPEQEAVASSRWHACGFSDVVTQAVVPNGSDAEIERAASRMADAIVDLVVYDCMGYGHELRARADSITKVPSILSVSLVARVMAELFDVN